MSLFAPLVTGDDVKLAQAKLLSDAQRLDSAVQLCGQLNANTRAQWGLFYITVVDAVRAGPTGIFTHGSDMDQTKALAAQLYSLQQQICATCQCPLPMTDPSTPDPTTESVLQFVRYATVATVVVAGAYAVSKIAEVLPLGKGRK